MYNLGLWDPGYYSRLWKFRTDLLQTNRPVRLQKEQRRRVYTYIYVHACTHARRRVSKVIIPSIKRPGTNFRDELFAIFSASKRNAHEEEAEPAEFAREETIERQVFRGRRHVLRLMTTARLTLSLERCSFGVGGGGEGRRRGRFTSISSVSTRWWHVNVWMRST